MGNNVENVSAYPNGSIKFKCTSCYKIISSKEIPEYCCNCGVKLNFNNIDIPKLIQEYKQQILIEHNNKLEREREEKYNRKETMATRW